VVVKPDNHMLGAAVAARQAPGAGYSSPFASATAMRLPPWECVRHQGRRAATAYAGMDLGSAWRGGAAVARRGLIALRRAVILTEDGHDDATADRRD
jgi:hypothetical protein